MASIAAMPLYSTIERIRNELRALGDPATVTPEQLYAFDQIHYRGTDAVRDAARVLALGSGDRVLDVGAGIGGPARFLAHTTGCHVTALELQEQMHVLGEDLTRRAGLTDVVTHVHADALTHPLPEAAFDAVVSWLAVHHIPQRPVLLQRLAATLRPGGRLYIEDLCERQPFTADDRPDIERTLYGVTMTPAADYVADVEAAGFVDVEIVDMHGVWSAFCAERAASWRAAAERHRRVHGDAIVATLDRFFSTVQRLFESGRLGGVRIVATRAATR